MFLPVAYIRTNALLLIVRLLFLVENLNKFLNKKTENPKVQKFFDKSYILSQKRCGCYILLVLEEYQKCIEINCILLASEAKLELIPYAGQIS